LLINVLRWRIPKENSEKQLEVWREMMDYQRSHRDKVYYTRSRFFNSTEEGSSEESWMFLDEYERREDYEKWMKAVREDAELVKLMDGWLPKWDALSLFLGPRKGKFGLKLRS
jgi:hypothetical protein